MKKDLSLLDMPIWKWLLALSIPIVLANMLQVWYQFTDSYWVWRIWADAVATTTFAWMIIFLTISIWSWFAVAWSILISQYFWAKNMKMINLVSAQTLNMIFAISILLWIIGFFTTPLLLNILNVDSSIYDTTELYIKISFIWLIFNFLFFMFQSIMRGIWEANLPIYIVLITVLINFWLDPLLIYWFWDFQGFWVIGAAIATIFTQFIATVIWLFILFSWKYKIKLTLPDFVPDLSIIKKSFKLWLPSSIEMTSRSLSYSLLIWVVTLFWTLAVASFWVAWNIIQFVIIFSMGISMATSILVWQNIWAWFIDKAKHINLISSIVSFVLMSILWIFVFITAPHLIAFFVPWEDEVIKLWAEILRITSLFFWFIWLQMSFNGVLRAIWKTKIPMYLTILGQLIIKIPLAYGLAKFAGLWMDWIWWAEPITSLIICAIMIFIIKDLDWSKSNLTKKEEENKKVIEETIIEEPVKSY